MDAPEERAVADASKQEIHDLHPTWDIKTEILDRVKFTPAEDYHQNYHIVNPDRYLYYKTRCGRVARLVDLWGQEEYDKYHDHHAVGVMKPFETAAAPTASGGSGGSPAGSPTEALTVVLVALTAAVSLLLLGWCAMLIRRDPGGVDEFGHDPIDIGDGGFGDDARELPSSPSFRDDLGPAPPSPSKDLEAGKRQAVYDADAMDPISATAVPSPQRSPPKESPTLPATSSLPADKREAADQGTAGTSPAVTPPETTAPPPPTAKSASGETAATVEAPSEEDKSAAASKNTNTNKKKKKKKKKGGNSGGDSQQLSMV